MSKLAERVARRLVDVFNTSPHWAGPKIMLPFDALPENGKAFAREQARGALAVIRDYIAEVPLRVGTAQAEELRALAVDIFDEALK